MKPEGSLSPGVINFAITPATNPMTIVQMILMSISPRREAKRAVSTSVPDHALVLPSFGHDIDPASVAEPWRRLVTPYSYWSSFLGTLLIVFASRPAG